MMCSKCGKPATRMLAFEEKKPIDMEDYGFKDKALFFSLGFTGMAITKGYVFRCEAHK